MQIEQIETFLDLCVTQSSNQTAERLGVTQSTVSGRITSLEKTVGQRLFQRSRSGTALTTEGLRFEPHARSLLHSWVTALNATNDTGISARHCLTLSFTLRPIIPLKCAPTSHRVHWMWPSCIPRAPIPIFILKH